MSDESSVQDLILDLRLGKSWAFEKVYQDCYFKVAAVIRSHSGTESQARDIFQEALIVLVQNLRKPDFELPPSKLTAYLKSVARNLWLKELRDNKIKLQEISETEKELTSFAPEDMERKIEYEEKHINLSKALLELDEACRKVIVDFHYKKLSMEEIAQQMNYTYAFARVKKYKCLKKLREIFLKGRQNES